MREVEVLDLDNETNIGRGPFGSWEWSPPMAKNRSAFGMAVLNGTIYAAGGWDEKGEVRVSGGLILCVYARMYVRTYICIHAVFSDVYVLARSMRARAKRGCHD
jgi:hypothetical protein